MKNKKIALVTGGLSGEAVISYRTAKTIKDNLNKERYEVYLIDISKEGWFYVAEDGSKIVVDKNDFSIVNEGQKIVFDIAFIAMHGTPGEDGKLQGYFDMIRLPYTSCSAAVAALTFNKRYTTAVAGAAGIAVARSILLMKAGFDLEEVKATLKFPVFVKPNNGGSSIGMSKADSKEMIEQAVVKAFQEDDQVIVEEMIEGREFTVGVYKEGNQVLVLPLTEVRADPGQSFFDFEAKYQGKSKETTPAMVEDRIAEKIRQTAQKVYALFNCRGVVRIDFIYHEAEAVPYMLEINTIPGQSEASVVPQQVRATGASLQDFYTKLVEQAFKV